MLLILLSDFDYFLITFVIRPSTNVDFMRSGETRRNLQIPPSPLVETRNKFEPPSVQICCFFLYLSHFLNRQSTTVNLKHPKTGNKTAKNG